MTSWLRYLVVEDHYLKKQSLIDCLVALFNYKVPTLRIVDAETLAIQIVGEMEANGTLIKVEEWLVFADKPLTGVIFQLSGSGCYSSTLHSFQNSYRCYSHHCQRAEKKIDLS